MIKQSAVSTLKSSDNNKRVEISIKVFNEKNSLASSELDDLLNVLVDNTYQYVMLPKFYARCIEVK